FDPLTATDGAARLLGENHSALGSWPLAITAYNHGRYGMKRAVRRLGTADLGVISEKYRSRTFGFASRNFYATFVAAYRAYENREHFFPGVKPSPLLAFEELSFGHYLHLPELARQAEVESDTLRTLNPALNREVWRGHLYLPEGYALKVPEGTSEVFQAAYSGLAEQHRSPHQVGLRYRVRQGDTLGAIAHRYGTSVSALKRANNLRGHLIRVGQNLLIPPSSGSVGSRPAARLASNPGTYRVRRGDTLSRIAARHGTTVAAVQAANGLRDADRLVVGQKLTIPSAESGGTHVVRQGETLAAIARRYGTTVNALRRANRLRGDLIRPSQVLVIP
ncbi:MAG: LysM peptidoglycan-binding domain-containing protein, partial [Holophagales bacterium]|nr:LysM peptidoglycan-binding domain-containing protein [Holophagales bacterium]